MEHICKNRLQEEKGHNTKRKLSTIQKYSAAYHMQGGRRTKATTGETIKCESDKKAKSYIMYKYLSLIPHRFQTIDLLILKAN